MLGNLKIREKIGDPPISLQGKRGENTIYIRSDSVRPIWELSAPPKLG